MTQSSSTIVGLPPATCQELANRGRRASQRLTRGLVIAVALVLLAFFAGHTGTSPHSAVVAIVAAPSPAHLTPVAAPSQATTPGISSSTTGAPTATATQPAGFGGQGDWWDPTTWIPDALGAAFKWIYDGFIQTFQEFIQWIFGLNLITTTDPQNTYQNQAVTTAWGVMEGVAFSLLTVVVLWIGYSVMASEGLGANYRTAREMVPRIVLCGLAIHFSLLFASFLIDFNNVLCGLSFKTFNDLVTLWQPGDPNAAQAIFTVIFAVIAFLLLIQEFCRLALIDVLLITAPLGFLCWLTPETQGWARLWSSTLVSAVLVQAVQMMVLALGGSLIHLAAIGGAPGGVSNLLMGIATLYSAFKVPSWLRSLGGGQAANVMQDTAGIASDVLVAARVAALFA